MADDSKDWDNIEAALKQRGSELAFGKKVESDAKCFADELDMLAGLLNAVDEDVWLDLGHSSNLWQLCLSAKAEQIRKAAKEYEDEFDWPENCDKQNRFTTGGGSSIIGWLVNKWDRVVIRLAEKSIRRVSARDNGIVCLFAGCNLSLEIDQVVDEFFATLRGERLINLDPPSGTENN